MGAAQAEVDQQLARRREHAARRFARDERLKMNEIDQARFDELCLRQRSDDLYHGFVAETERALRHRPHLTTKTKFAEVIQ